MLKSFKYLDRVSSSVDDEWPALVQNIVKAQTVWRIMARILIREKARPQVSIFFFKAVVRSVLLFSEETWVITPQMGWSLVGFQYQV